MLSFDFVHNSRRGNHNPLETETGRFIDANTRISWNPAFPDAQGTPRLIAPWLFLRNAQGAILYRA